MNVQQSLVRLSNSRWQDCSNLTGTIDQQSLALFFNSYRYNSSTVTGTIAQESLAWLFNSRWHSFSTVTGKNVQQTLARLFSSHRQDFFFFYTGRIFHQWYSLLKNHAMYQEYNTWSRSDQTLFDICTYFMSWKIANTVDLNIKRKSFSHMSYMTEYYNIRKLFSS